MTKILNQCTELINIEIEEAKKSFRANETRKRGTLELDDVSGWAFNLELDASRPRFSIDLLRFTSVKPERESFSIKSVRLRLPSFCHYSIVVIFPFFTFHFSTSEV
jgi:hypothetical protein